MKSRPQAPWYIANPKLKSSAHNWHTCKTCQYCADKKYCDHPSLITRPYCYPWVWGTRNTSHPTWCPIGYPDQPPPLCSQCECFAQDDNISSTNYRYCSHPKMSEIEYLDISIVLRETDGTDLYSEPPSWCPKRPGSSK